MTIRLRCRVVQGRRRLRATDSEAGASADAAADGGQLTYVETPPDFGMRVPSGDTDDEPDMDLGCAAAPPLHACCGPLPQPRFCSLV